MNIVPVFYPANRKVWTPGLMDSDSRSLVSIYRADYASETGILKLRTVEFNKGLPRILGFDETAARWLLGKNGLRRLYAAAPSYGAQKKLLEKFFEDSGLRDMRIVRCELTGDEPVIIPGTKSDSCVRKVFFERDGKFTIWWQYIGESAVTNMDSRTAIAWWWASESLRNEARKHADPDKFILGTVSAAFRIY